MDLGSAMPDQGTLYQMKLSRSAEAQPDLSALCRNHIIVNGMTRSLPINTI
jgi:hypothetical protein